MIYMNKTLNFQIKYKAQGYTETHSIRISTDIQISEEGDVLYMKYRSSEQFKFEST